MAPTDLGRLADPTQFHEMLDISGQNPRTLIEQLRMMLIIRKAEEKIGDKVTAGNIKTPCHLGIGQEAIAVGVSAHLRSTDRVFGGHRSHAHYLAMGGDVHGLFAEVLGKATGCSKGMGGSMHLHGASVGFIASVPIVAATVPIAAGAALAAKMDGGDDVAVSYFGDGAVEEGALQEALNLAAVQNLPIIFICENNLFASHMRIDLRQPATSTVRFAEAHGIEAEVVDGNDVIAVAKTAEKAITKSRRGEGPSYIEAVTYRWRGHVGPREDIDVGVKRKENLTLWKGRDPVQRLAAALEAKNFLSTSEFSQLQDEVDVLIEDTWDQAERDPYPDEKELLDLVYFSEKVE